MKHLLFLVFILSSLSSFAQIAVTNTKEYTPTEDYSNVKVVPIHTDENSSVFMIFVKKSVRKHLHNYHTEVVTVLEGTGVFYLGGKTMTIKKGDHIIIPPGTAHAVTTTSAKPLKVISIQSPEFIGQDRVFVADKKTTTANKKDNSKKNKDKEEDSEEEEEDDDIPEYE